MKVCLIVALIILVHSFGIFRAARHVGRRMLVCRMASRRKPEMLAADVDTRNDLDLIELLRHFSVCVAIELRAVHVARVQISATLNYQSGVYARTGNWMTKTATAAFIAAEHSSGIMIYGGTSSCLS